MGNCSMKDVVVGTDNPIRVMTDSGSILEFKTPTPSVGNVLRNYPGHGIFRKGHLSVPLFQHEQLSSGEVYYLLPLKQEKKIVSGKFDRKSVEVEQASPRLSSGEKCERHRIKPSKPALEVLPSSGNGTWKVKLVIETKQLEEILSEQVTIEALIEKMRAIATSENSTPRRSKIYPPWSIRWRPAVHNMFKIPLSRTNSGSEIDL